MKGTMQNEPTLDQLKEKFSKIASAWNGKDETFNHEGETYTEHQAIEATDILDTIKDIEYQTGQVEYHRSMLRKANILLQAYVDKFDF